MQKILQASIASGTALSTSIDIANVQPLAIQVPSNWTAADITVQVSRDGSSWFNLFDSAGDEVLIKAAASRHIALALPLMGIQFLRFRSGTAATPVNQTTVPPPSTAREITIIAEVR